MKIKKLEEYNKKKILIFIGSARSKNNCPGQDSKTSKIVKEAIKNLPKDIELDIVDLSFDLDEPIIQPCKGCISTSGGAHCAWYCNCYSKGLEVPDKMYEADIYKRLEDCDAFILFSPINWWSVPSQVKAMFDRLVCASLTMTSKQAVEVFGKDNIKNPAKTKKFSETEEFKKMVKNHLEGKVAAFYIHGDDGANDYEDRRLPASMAKYKIGNFNDPKNAILPIVWQCRYSGIDAPEELIDAFYMNEDVSYSEANDLLKEGKLDFAIKKANKLIIYTYEYLKK